MSKNNNRIVKEKNIIPVENKNGRNYDDQVEGRNSVLELLEIEKDINKIFVTRG